MVLFFKKLNQVIGLDIVNAIDNDQINRLIWLFGEALPINEKSISGTFVGPRREMISPWSTNAVEITINMGIKGIRRMEVFRKVDGRSPKHDPMLESVYHGLDQHVFSVDLKPEPVREINDIAAYNDEAGLALSLDEIEYLDEVALKIRRPLTDSEVFGFSQVNSEHCRHKIFNGTFILDGVEMKDSLFALIKRTSNTNPNGIISAYKDNVAFIVGPRMEQFSPETQDKADFFSIRQIESVISLKAETHNFPTTVEPFNGAATGSGGEVRDRMAGGKASIPLMGTAVYMTSYPRLNSSAHEVAIPERQWLYHPPAEILIKASNGASDFGNKFGQPLLCGSLLTFEHTEDEKMFGYDKVIMQAGGIGFANLNDSLKETPESGDILVVLGGDNYRIGMGGGAVSSVATGELGNAIELNAVQRSNPEMQKRVYNAIRAMAESEHNPIVAIHDHGAGGHLNCLSELVEATGGVVALDKLPVGDPTLSAREIIGNESQERMGLIIKEKDLPFLTRVARRERAPIYRVGETTGDMKLIFQSSQGHQAPIDLELAYLFGKPPKTVLEDVSGSGTFDDLIYDPAHIETYIHQVLAMEAVACKDWLTNKVDRSVTGKGAVQQTAGEIQLPVNDLAVVSIDYRGVQGVATSIGHAPVSGLIDPGKASRLSVAESLTNLVWAPLQRNLDGVSLSANWMWPARNPGENIRLYQAVSALSDFVCDIGINVPTGKDSMSMTQKYPDGQVVYSPGTVIISTVAEVADIRRVVPQVMQPHPDSLLLYVDLSDGKWSLGGSSFAQVMGKLGKEAPDVAEAAKFRSGFNLIQKFLSNGWILSGHDVSAGGLITTLLEMVFPNRNGGLDVNLDPLPCSDLIRLLFSEQPGVVVQTIHAEECMRELVMAGVQCYPIGKPIPGRNIRINKEQVEFSMNIDLLRDSWYRTSYLFDRLQTKPELAEERFAAYKKQPLNFRFPGHFTGRFTDIGLNPDRSHRTGVKAAIIREKGVNGDREMAYAMHLAGFDVKDIHMTDLISGRETLEDIRFIVFVGGFSNSDVLGSAKGWAGAFLYNEKARFALDQFYARKDTLSLGVCNGCQLMVELGLVYPDIDDHPRMTVNASGKFESAFLTVDVESGNSVMLSSLNGSRLGIWVAHGEGQFQWSGDQANYRIPLRFSYHSYPGNPNGSPDGAAAICSTDGRHLAMMPHLERAFLPWQWAHYPANQNDEMAPWLEAFVNARKWIEGFQK